MTVIAIDWTGAKRVARKLWLAEASDGQLLRLEHLQSREDAAREVIRHCQQDPISIVGIDFAFSMPAWYIRSLGLQSAAQLWVRAEQEGERWLRECCAPFWGRKGKCRPSLQEHFRSTECDVLRIPGISPKSTFQINGAGAVGTGSIRGMPFLSRMRDEGISIWPFDAARLPFLVEIYPRLLTGAINKSSSQDRNIYMQEHWSSVAPVLRTQAAASEDSFDAAVSALVMDRHRIELLELQPSVDSTRSLEGEIWFPREATG